MLFMKEELSRVITQLRQVFPILQQSYSVKTLEVFGSYVRAEEQPGSDLDLLVTFSEDPGLFEYIELENYLSENLGVKVDLVMKDALKPAIGKRILKEAVSV
jgi:predicted nucleotidyltransferase